MEPVDVRLRELITAITGLTVGVTGLVAIIGQLWSKTRRCTKSKTSARRSKR